MKKLLLLISFFMGITCVNAQELKTDEVVVSHSGPITDLSQLQSGQTVFLMDNSSDPARLGCLYVKQDNNNIHINKFRPADNALGSKSYVWITKKISENTFTFESYAQREKYIQVYTNGQSVPLSATSSTFTIKPTDVEGNWYIYNNNQYFNAEDKTNNTFAQNGSFTFWSEGHPYQIYPVVMAQVTKNTWTITVESYIDGVASAKDRYTSKVFEGPIWLHRPDRAGKTLTKAEVVQNGETTTVPEGKPVQILSDATIKYYYTTNSEETQKPRYEITTTTDFEKGNIKWQKIICDRRTVNKDNGQTIEHNGLLYYSADAHNMKADAMTINVDNTNKIFYFAFVSDDNGQTCKIYNKAASDGQGLIPLGYYETMPQFVRGTDIPTSWSLYADNSQRDFAVSITVNGGTTYWDNAVPDIKYWNQGVENKTIKSGNKFHVETLQETLDGFAATADWVNALSNDKKEEFKNIYADGITFGTYINAIEFARNPENQLQIENGFYRLRNYSRSFSTGNTQNSDQGGYLEYTDAIERPTFAGNNTNTKFYANDIITNRIGTIWKVAVNENKQFTLYNGNGGQYIKKDGIHNQDCQATSNIDEAELFCTQGLAWGRSSINLADNTGEYLHITAGNEQGTRLILWNEGGFNGPSAWYIEKVEDIELVISSLGYSTANYPYAIQIPDGVKAYYASEFNGGSITLTPISSTTLPANMPVVFEGKPGVYSAQLIFDESTVPSKEKLLSNNTNYLEGTLLMNNIPEAKNVYVLANKNEGLKFYQLEANAGNRKVTQNKAYLVAEASVSNIKSFNMEFNDNTTSIKDVNNHYSKKDIKYYDLNGRQVQNPQKGIYITSEGKKVLFF